MRQPVRLLKGYRMYMRGEIAGFAKEQSDDLIRRGIAVAVDPSGELIAYQPPAESQRERAPALEVWPPATEQRGTGEDALAGTVADACERLLTIEDPGQLERMQRAERAGRQRADVLQAVAGRMSGSWPPPPGEAPQESRLSDDDLRRLYAERMLRDLGDPYAFQMTVRRFNGQSPIHIPAMVDIMRDPHPLVVVQKSAQIGITEAVITKALHTAVARRGGRGNALLAMPTGDQMADFVAARIDAAIQESALLRAQMQPEPPRRRSPDNRRVKAFRSGGLLFTRSAVARQLTSVDVDFVGLDEYDWMEEGAFELARERIASSRDPQLLLVSTPRYPDAGINAKFLLSDQRSYYLPCPSCGFEQPLVWERNVDLEAARIVCRICRDPLDVHVPGRWIAEAPGNTEIHGYKLSRLYAPWLDLPQLIAQSREDTLAARRAFMNGGLGEVYTDETSGLTRDVLLRNRRDYGLDDYQGQACDMGVDVGKRLHVAIREHVFESDYLYEDEEVRSGRFPRLWWAGTVDSFDELVRLMREFNIRSAVVDHEPEGHLAGQFAARFKRTVWLVRYSRHEPGHQYDRDAEPHPLIRANRTEALDAAFKRFHDGLADLPRDAHHLGAKVREGIGEYFRELLAPQRTIERDARGRDVARWVEGGKPDHYAHAEAYCQLASEGPVRPEGFVI